MIMLNEQGYKSRIAECTRMIEYWLTELGLAYFELKQLKEDAKSET